MIKMAERRRIPQASQDASLPPLAAPLRLLADPTRLRILECLMGGLQCNCTIKESLGLPMNLISHHLKLLKEAGLVRAERDPSDARWIYYEIDPQAMGALRDSLFAALDPSRLRPRADHCGPPGCCPSAKPRKGTSMRRTR
ncbi:MAG: ArsR/SmtB family transcription factor [Acidobacteriota bacterium]